MNRYTKRAMIFAILVPAVTIAGILIFVIAGDAISNSLTPPESDDPGAQLGSLFVSIGVMMQTWAIMIVDVIFTSILVYTFAYFSHKNALTAIAELSETGGELKLPKFLRVFSVIEMIISGAVALITLLLFNLWQYSHLCNNIRKIKCQKNYSSSTLTARSATRNSCSTQ